MPMLLLLLLMIIMMLMMMMMISERERVDVIEKKASEWARACVLAQRRRRSRRLLGQFVRGACHHTAAGHKSNLVCVCVHSSCVAVIERAAGRADELVARVHVCVAFEQCHTHMMSCADALSSLTRAVDAHVHEAAAAANSRNVELPLPIDRPQR